MMPIQFLLKLILFGRTECSVVFLHTKQLKAKTHFLHLLFSFIQKMIPRSIIYKGKINNKIIGKGKIEKLTKHLIDTVE